MSTAALRLIAQQLKADLVGKDAYRGVTLTYAWLANQFGHFGLGYIPTTLFCLCTGRQQLALPAAIGVSVCWLVFELCNLLLPLLMGEKLPQQQQRQKVQYVFRPDWWHLIFDTATDLLFFWTGAFTAALALRYSALTLFITLALFALLIVPSYYWYLSKIYLQQAACPLQIRLSQWNRPISPRDKATIADFLNSKKPSRHLLIFGGGGSGKTSMGVALLHEVALRRQPCCYIPGMKLLSQFSQPDEALRQQGSPGLNWRQAGLLLIDDLHPGDPVTDEFIEADRFFHHLHDPELGDINCKALAQKAVIWILGIEGYQKGIELHWQARLQGLGIAPQDIYCVNLPDSISTAAC